MDGTDPSTITTLDLVKEHLRITGDAEDTTLEMYLDAAIATFIQRTGEDIVTNWDTYNEYQQNAANLALCQMVGDSYENREAATPLSISVNRSTETLLNIFRFWDT